MHPETSRDAHDPKRVYLFFALACGLTWALSAPAALTFIQAQPQCHQAAPIPFAEIHMRRGLAGIRIQVIDAVGPQFGEGHPQCLAQWNGNSVLGETGARGQRQSPRVMGSQRFKVPCEMAREAGAVASGRGRGSGQRQQRGIERGPENSMHVPGPGGLMARTR